MASIDLSGPNKPKPAPVQMPAAGSLGMAGAPVAPLQQVELPTLGTVNPGTVSVGQFGGQAPTPTPFGDFTAPDPAAVANDPYFKFRAAEGQKAIERSAAARGTLLNGGTLKALEGYRQGLASEESGKAYDRALSTYGTNRDTNAQNFGQQMGAFQGNLGAFQANSGAKLGEFNANSGAAIGAAGVNNAAALNGYDRAAAAAGDQQVSDQHVVDANYAQSVEAARQAAASTQAMQQPTRSLWPFRDRSMARR